MKFWKMFLLGTMMCGLSAAGVDSEVAAAEQIITKNGAQASIKGDNSIFTGDVRIDMLFSKLDDREISGAYVTFEPCARSAWHIHPKGQMLIVTSGSGLTQEWGKPIQVINPGDVIWCPPGVKHWHGGGYKTAMTHISVCEAADGSNVKWLEKVSDKEYYADKVD